jgi:hypothetical protein
MPGAGFPPELAVEFPHGLGEEFPPSLPVPEAEWNRIKQPVPKK